jgi:hypothetical protein
MEEISKESWYILYDACKTKKERLAFMEIQMGYGALLVAYKALRKAIDKIEVETQD